MESREDALQLFILNFALRSASSARQRGIFGSCVLVSLKGEERGLQQNLGQGISFFPKKLGLEEGVGEGC